MKIHLEPIGRLIPASYNPRKADPERLALVELSLKKLGWLLPVYATSGGEILSGHQRTLVARNLGYERAPVVFVDEMADGVRKAVNILFNRSTNDMEVGATTGAMTRQLQGQSVHRLAAALPDHPTDDFPCLKARQVPTEALTRTNAGRWIPYARNVANALWVHGIMMPVVVTPDLRIVNGLGRVQVAAEKKLPALWCVEVTPEQARFADAMLNRLSMDFDIHTRYADLLRYNSFRRPRGRRDYLGRCFTFPLLGRTASKQFDVTRPESRREWTSTFGSTVLDFGAGLLDETRILQGVGIDCTPFEPFFLVDGQINRLAARELALKFLARVADGTKWSSIFLSAIMNSVPFVQDRLHIVTLLSALAWPSGKVYAVSASTRQAGFQTVTNGGFINASDQSRLQFLLGYEPRTTLADFSETPKVQKYHTLSEWQKLWLQGFRSARVSESSNNAQVIASSPRPVSRDKLRAAIEFEFDLPYPDGGRMGLVTEAKEAFRKRLNIDLGR